MSANPHVVNATAPQRLGAKLIDAAPVLLMGALVLGGVPELPAGESSVSVSASASVAGAAAAATAFGCGSGKPVPARPPATWQRVSGPQTKPGTHRGCWEPFCAECCCSSQR